MTNRDECKNCGGNIIALRPTGLGLRWTHEGGDRYCPEGVLTRYGARATAEAPARCPECNSTRITLTQEAWLDRERCSHCGYHQIRMIGD